MSLPKSLSLAAVVIAVAGLMVSMPLGYAAEPAMRDLANGIFVAGVLVALVLGVVAAVVAIARRGRKSSA
jgi:uncharacterized membrane protein